MAPVHPRQFHTLPPPRAPKGPPAIPVPVTTLISLKVFFQLFAGTLFIFFIGVLFWKTGQFLRYLTQDRVLGGNRKTTTRYARTWYGWVPLSRHEANKEVFRKCYTKLRKWTAWKSSRASYRWVWWDPGNKELEKRNEDKRPLRWLPAWLRSYEFTPADAIWNPGSPRTHTVPSKEEEDEEYSATATGSLSLHNRQALMSGGLQSLSRSLKSRRRQLDPGIFRPDLSSTKLAGQQDSLYRSSVRKGKLPVRDLGPGRSRTFWSLNYRMRSPRHKNVSSLFNEREPRVKRAASLPSVLNGLTVQARYHALSDSSCVIDNTEEHGNFPDNVKAVRRGRKYQAWSARMQVQTSKLVRRARRRPYESQGPPGSPVTELLASLSTEKTASVKLFRRPRGELVGRFASEQNDGGSVRFRRRYHTDRLAERDSQHNLPKSPLTGLYPPTAARTVPLKRRRLQSRRDIRDLVSSLELDRPIERPKTHTPLYFQTLDHNRSQDICRSSIPLGDLNDWEIRLMYNLDRKLEWLLNEVDPGRKPFHFPTLANHWLNPLCWQVTDPTSRVNLDAKRQCGDPRFNTPYPEPTYQPKHKYSIRRRKRAQTPRIDSWRIAVNRQRRQAGLRDILRAVELFDSSADEPPDGKVDPACWILRKPPQGFEMSNKQKNAFYEGGAGWQETLDDWQKVGRGYRVRKAIHEGRVNRTRVKEVAVGFTRYYRIASSKLSKRSHDCPGLR